jgi:hypothetical protein
VGWGNGLCMGGGDWRVQAQVGTQLVENPAIFTVCDLHVLVACSGAAGLARVSESLVLSDVVLVLDHNLRRCSLELSPCRLRDLGVGSEDRL